MPPLSRDGLRKIKEFGQLVEYLRDELEWPIESNDFDDLTFDYEPEELGIDTQTAAKIQEIKQLRPLVSTQPWGVFFVKFEPKRLPVVALRRMLSQLVIKRRANSKKSEQPTWHMHDLLFISNFGEGEQRQITFAHFSGGDDSELPTLKVLGWDDADTALHIDHVHSELKSKLHWPDDEDDLKGWRERWQSAFTLKHREVITTSKQMSVTLAELASRIRKRMNAVMAVETDKGPIRKLHKAFKEALIHDLSEDDFADMYAQTITYGLLTARVSRPAGLVADNVTDMIPITNPFLKDLLASFLKIGGRKNKLDFDELGVNDVVDTLRKANMEAVLRDFGDRRPEEDPVIFFYEDFLKEYDKQKKVKRGVFYTPKPVVSYIVRSVHELLKSEFGLKDGLADTTTWGEMAKRNKNLSIPEGAKPGDPFVTILDPATGTGTFLVEVIDVIYNTMTEKWKAEGKLELQFKQLWNEYVPKHLLPRLFGYELMMAPYAIAHMKIGLKLHETGYQFSTEERARIFLTNALEPAQDFSDQFAALAPELAEEADAVNAVKRDQRFTVVVGNPPYSLLSSNLNDFQRSLVEAYKYVDGKKLKERGALQMEKILNDDYVKFLSVAESTVVQNGVGMLGMITNHSFLDNPIMRGMRFHFLQSFSRMWFVNLGGSTKKSQNISQDANVFDIQQGVSVNLCLKGIKREPQTVQYRSVLGSRPDKYSILWSSNLEICKEKLVPKANLYLFVPTDLRLWDEYSAYHPLDEIFPLHSIGAFTSKDHFVINRAPEVLAENAILFRDSDLESTALCNNLGLNTKKAWNVDRSRSQIKHLSDDDIKNNIVFFPHRPFDYKYMFYHQSLIWSMAFPVNRNLLSGNNLALVTSRQLASVPWNHAFCSNTVVEMFYISNKTKEGNHVFPLFITNAADNGTNGMQNDLNFQKTETVNISTYFLEYFSELSESVIAGKDSNKRARNSLATNIFYYTYVIMHSGVYRSRYIELLKSDFPRIPLPVSRELFNDLAKLGGELAQLHLMESAKLEDFITGWIGPKPSGEIEKPTYSKGTVWIDKAKTQGFKGVPEDVWNFRIGCYQVCDKWLKDRKDRQLSADDIVHYQRIVVALNETIRLMAEIDKVIDKHGGWPGAFKGKED